MGDTGSSPSSAATSSICQISVDNLSHFVETREPCVIRGSARHLAIVKGCRDNVIGKRSNVGVHWLAEKVGASKFRVFVARPAIESGNESETSSDSIKPSIFTLDGTEHPSSVLTTSCCLDLTLTEMINYKDWQSRYMVEDQLPEGSLQTLVPPRPPSPLSLPFSSLDVKQRQLFVSFGSCQTQLHRDCFDNIYVCAFGERKWTIASPDDNLEREPGSVSAMIPPPSEYNDPKMQSSSLSGAEPVFSTITLLPGDAIFVPKDYWHSIQTKSKASIALNWYFDPVEKEGNRSSKRRKLEDTDQSENLYRDDKV